MSCQYEERLLDQHQQPDTPSHTHRKHLDIALDDDDSDASLALDIDEKHTTSPITTGTSTSASTSAVTPSPVYRLYQWMYGVVISVCRLYITSRWYCLQPLYRRVNLPGLRGFAIIELLLIAMYLIVNGYYVLPMMFDMLVPVDEFPVYMVKMVQASYRLGTIGTYSVLLLWLPTTRHSVWNYLLGISFDRCAFYHIWLSRIAIFILTLHGFGLYGWMIWKKSFLRELTEGGITGKVPTGEIALLGGFLLLITSVGWFRRHYWEFFIRCHYAGLIIFTVFSLLHSRAVIKLTIVPVALYGLDLLLRFYQWTRPVQLLDAQVLDGNVTRLEWRLQNFEFEAGQFVMVCVPLLSPFEWHPYSISSSPHHSTVILHSKKSGEWTTRLQSLAQSFDANKPFRIYIEGPYGCLALPLPQYRHVLLVSGGMGVTPMLSIYNDLRHTASDEHTVKFVWSMRDRRLIQSVWRDIEKADQQVTGCLSPHVAISPGASNDNSGFCTHFHLTSSAAISATIDTSNNASNCASDNDGSDWVVSHGRPRLSKLFRAMKKTIAESPDCTRCAVLVCGPDSLIDRCRRLCVQHSDGLLTTAPPCGRKVCFDLHEETYEW